MTRYARLSVISAQENGSEMVQQGGRLHSILLVVSFPLWVPAEFGQQLVSWTNGKTPLYSIDWLAPRLHYTTLPSLSYSFYTHRSWNLQRIPSLSQFKGPALNKSILLLLSDRLLVRLNKCPRSRIRAWLYSVRFSGARWRDDEPIVQVRWSVLLGNLHLCIATTIVGLWRRQSLRLHCLTWGALPEWKYITTRL